MPLALALSRASFSSSSLLSLLSLFLLVSMINEQIQEKTKSAQQRRSPMRKGTLRPRPQEKKKWTRARTSSRRSRALAAQTKRTFVKDIFTLKTQCFLSHDTSVIQYYPT
jgi:hypothetical protein